MNRIIAFDYLRSIAILGIVMCHFCFNFRATVWFAGWCGGTFNVLFLMMSALLLGLTWNKNGRPQYGFDFLKHRFGKLSRTYYLFLIVMFAFCFAVGGYTIGVKDVVMHVAYLPWFDKLDGFGHLWFMTMIAICYMGVLVVSRLKLAWGGQLWFVYSLMIFVAIALMFLLGRRGLPGYMFLYLTIFVISFIEAENIVQMAYNRSRIIAIVHVIIVSTSLYAVFAYNMTDDITKLICMFAAFSLFGLSMMGLNEAKSNKVVSFVAGISFEIYLVHHIIAFGRFSVMKVAPNWWTGFLLLITVSIVLSWCLNKISCIKIRK